MYENPDSIKVRMSQMSPPRRSGREMSPPRRSGREMSPPRRSGREMKGPAQRFGNWGLHPYDMRENQKREIARENEKRENEKIDPEGFRKLD